MKVFKMIVNLSWFNLHRNDYMRLVLSDKSIRLLNKHQNRLKLETIKQIIDKLNNCIYNNSSEYSKNNFKVLIGYGTILLKK